MIKSKLIATLFAFAFIFFGIVKTASAANYYVASSGSDSNPGTIDEPFRTIQKGVNNTNAGDTTYVRGGTYHEAITISKSGTSSSPIIIAGYPGERPVIDGEYTLPTGTAYDTDPRTGNEFVYTPLVMISGNYVKFDGFEIKRSRGRGIQTWINYSVHAHHIEIKNNDIHHIRLSGVMIHDSENIIVDNNRVWHSCDYAPWVDGRTSAVEWPGGIAMQRSSFVTVSNNQVFNNWGEGIIPMASDNVEIVGNTVYDNFAAQIYLERSSYSTVEKNLVYHTNDPNFRRSGNPSPCLGLADELHQFGSTPQRTRNVNVINNIIVGCSQNFFWWGEADGTNGLRDSVIAHNTIINAVSNTANPYGIIISDGNHQSSKIENNIVLQNDGVIASSVSNVNFSKNLWSKTPEADARDSGDIIADPKLVNANATLSPGEVNPGWYKLTSTSAAINSAVKLSEVSNDYFGSARGNDPDIGAHEFDGILQSTVTPTITSLLTPTDYLTSTPYPTSPPGENILLNPSFELGISDWNFHTDGSGEFSVSLDAYEGLNSGQISITQEGTNVQLNQTSMPIEPDTNYLLSLAAKSSSGNDMEVRLHQHESPYSNYGLSSLVDIGTSWQEYSFKFTTTGFSTSATDTRLRFWLAPYDTPGDEYFIDNVSLIKAEDVTPTPIPGDGNADEIVDTQDYAIWIINFGLTDVENPSQGDYNDDGYVDGKDYTVWFKNYSN